MGVHAPPAFAEITTTAPRSLSIKSKSENEGLKKKNMISKDLIYSFLVEIR
jgi:hypothetical protein